MRTLTWIAVVLLAASAGAQTQPGLTAADVLERYIAALGGREAFSRIHAVVVTGTLSGNNVLDELETGSAPSAAQQKGRFESYWKAPGKRLNVRTVEGYGTSKLGFDGAHAWQRSPGAPPRRITGEALTMIQRGRAVNPVLDWRSLYRSVEYKGAKRIGANECYVIRLVRRGGEAISDFFDTQTFLLIHSESFVHVGEHAIKREIDFSDYREAGGVRWPFRIAHRDEHGQSLAVTTSIRVNVPVDDSLFEMPNNP